MAGRTLGEAPPFDVASQA